MKNNYFLLFLLLLVSKCVTLRKIEKSTDLETVKKYSSFIYAKIKMHQLKKLEIQKILLGSNIESDTIRIENFYSFEISRTADSFNQCVLYGINKKEDLILGEYRQFGYKDSYSPKIIKYWKFEIPLKDAYYYLGTITQDKELSLNIDDSNEDKEECDNYVSSIIQSFDPKTSEILKAKKYYPEQ